MYINDIEQGQTVFFIANGGKAFKALITDIITFTDNGPEAILILTEPGYQPRKMRMKIEDLYPTRRAAIEGIQLNRLNRIRKYKASIKGTAGLVNFLFDMIADQAIETEKLAAAIQSATEMGYKIDNKWINFMNTGSGITK